MHHGGAGPEQIALRRIKGGKTGCDLRLRNAHEGSFDQLGMSAQVIYLARLYPQKTSAQCRLALHPGKQSLEPSRRLRLNRQEPNFHFLEIPISTIENLPFPSCLSLIYFPLLSSCAVYFLFHTFNPNQEAPMRRLLLLCSFCFLTLSATFAQVDTGTIAGSVRDSQGASVPTATISITAVATGVTTKAQTDSSGEFVSPPLRPGDYKVVAEAQGFKTSTRNLVTLKVQDRLRVDFDMAVGSISENIEVTS